MYSEDFDVSEVLETVFEKGMEHKLHFFMALSPREYEELAGYRALRQFGSWKQESTLEELLMNREFLIMK